jgi:hypothetical protein
VFCNEINYIQVGEVGLMGNELLMELLKAYRNPQTNRVEGFANLGELRSFVKRNRIKFEFEAAPKKAKKSKIDVEVEEANGERIEKKKGGKEREKKKRKTIEKFLKRAVELGYGESTVAQLLEDVRGIGSEGLE